MGYNTVEAKYEWNVLAVGFANVTNQNDAIPIQDAFPYVEGMTATHVPNTADQIQIPDPQTGGYTIYYMSDGYDLRGRNYSDARLHKWCKNGSADVTGDTIAAGTAFWFLRRSFDQPLTNKIAGAVSMLGSYEKPVTGTWRLVANPYPADLPLNDCLPYAVGMTATHTPNTADQLQIWDAATGGYAIYYMSDGYDLRGRNYSDARLHKWCKNGSADVTTDKLPAGYGAWYLRRGESDVNITLVRPFSVAE